MTPWTVAYQVWDFPSKSTGVSCHFLLQEIFLTPGLLHCRQTLYRLGHQGRQTLSQGRILASIWKREICGSIELTAWSQDSLGCGPSQVGAGPCRICVFLLLPASASGLHPSLPLAHRGPFVSTGLGQGQARPGVACKKQAWGQSAD